MAADKKPASSKKLMGDHWKESGYAPLYQLYRRVEAVASQLERRRRKGWVPAVRYIDELYDISIQLKVLDSQSKN